MNTATIRPYQPEDRQQVIRLLEDLQDYLVEIDPLKRLIRTAEFGEVVFQDDLEDVEKKDGAIFVAEDTGKLVGFVIGIVSPSDKVNQAQSATKVAGRVLELYVSPDYRGTGLSQQLMEKMEAHFRSKGCEVVWIAVFTPNIVGQKFYAKQGYAEREKELMKQL